ncbi:MAG: hypothetical protein RIC14_07815 [Filomicrobium sp.]
MSDRIQGLEQTLLMLGQKELKLERQLQLLKERTRSAVDFGDLKTADANWELYEEARKELASVQLEIGDVESILYRLRRRR